MKLLYLILLPIVCSFKIYFLRHEDRPLQTSTFYIELTEKGHVGAQKLVSKLNPLNIDRIYSSPFIRTLQTVKPYTSQNEVQVRTDYSLAETISDYNQVEGSKKYLSPFECSYFNVDPVYKSLIYVNELKYPESYEDLQKRANKFMEYIHHKYSHTDHKILVVSHMNVINALLNAHNVHVDRELNAFYPMGGLSTIQDDSVLML